MKCKCKENVEIKPLHSWKAEVKYLKGSLLHFPKITSTCERKECGWNNEEYS
jgi:hypothetical protein